jgi:hypothetical protein
MTQLGGHDVEAPRAKTTRCHLHDAAHKLHGPNFLPGIDKSKPHRFLSAKKMVAF